MMKYVYDTLNNSCSFLNSPHLIYHEWLDSNIEGPGSKTLKFLNLNHEYDLTFNLDNTTPEARWREDGWFCWRGNSPWCSEYTEHFHLILASYQFRQRRALSHCLSRLLGLFLLRLVSRSCVEVCAPFEVFPVAWGLRLGLVKRCVGGRLGWG